MSTPPTAMLSSMQSPWRKEDWKPSALTISNWSKPDIETASEAVGLLITCTKDLIERHYHPAHWLARARALHWLGYPELAVGDAYKALLLCDAEKSCDIEVADKVKSTKGVRVKPFQSIAHKKAPIANQTHLKDLDHIAASLKTLRPEVCYTIIAALETCTSYQEALDFTGESIHNHPLDERFKATYHRLNRLFLDGDAQRGAVIAVHYPWMSFEHRKRTAAVIVSSTAHMEGLSGGVLTLGESKTIAGTPKRKSRHVRWLDHDIAKPFAIDGTAIAKGSAPAKDFDKKAKLATKVSVPDSDVLGVFATQDVIRGTLLLSDTTVTGATNVKTPKMCGNCFAKLTRFDYTLPGYGVRWCSSLCRDLAVATYLKPTHDGNQDEKLAWVQQHADRNYEQHPNFPLLLRFLATFVQEKTLHPLSHELAAPLTGNSHGEHKFTFTLHENIATPYRMLRDLGVDVFSDFRFETWVLLVLQHRISINKRAEPSAEGGFMSSVNPCFSMFNHSCESNASWKDVGTTTVEITASKNIKKGEEVYLDYGGTREEQRHWFGEGGCRCTKCRKEGEGFV